MKVETKAVPRFDTSSPFGTWNPRGLAKVSLNLLQGLPRHSLCKRLAYLLRKPVKSGRQTFFDRQIWNLRLRLCARGNLTEQRWLTMEQFHDWPERQCLAQALAENSVFLDVGANAGFYTFWVLAQSKSAQVIAVEPSRVMIERLTFNLHLNHLQNRVRIFPCAATPEICEVTVVEGKDNLGQTSVDSDGAGERVPGRPLLNILQEVGVPRLDAMKIDIEGHEVPVLAEFFSQAPRSLWPRLVIGEIVGENGGALKGLLAQNQYRLQTATKMNGIFCLRD